MSPTIKRFWVFGPIDFDGVDKWAVVDGHDLPGRTVPKPAGFSEFWPTEAEAKIHADFHNGERK